MCVCVAPAMGCDESNADNGMVLIRYNVMHALCHGYCLYGAIHGYGPYKLTYCTINM